MKKKNNFLRTIKIIMLFIISFFSIYCEELEGNRFDPESSNYKKPEIIFKDSADKSFFSGPVYMEHLPFKVKVECSEFALQEYKYRIIETQLYNNNEKRLLKDWSPFILGNTSNYIEIYSDGMVTLDVATRYINSPSEELYSLTLFYDINNLGEYLSLQPLYYIVPYNEFIRLKLVCLINNSNNSDNMNISVIIRYDASYISFVQCNNLPHAEFGSSCNAKEISSDNGNLIEISYSASPCPTYARTDLVEIHFRATKSNSISEIDMTDIKVYLNNQLKTNINKTPPVKVQIK